MSGALAAARRLRAGQPLDGCPQIIILELLQELELLAATPRETDLPQPAAVTAHQGKEQHMRPEDRAKLEQNGEAAKADTDTTGADGSDAAGSGPSSTDAGDGSDTSTAGATADSAAE